MVFGHSHRRDSRATAGGRSSTDEQHPDADTPDDETVVDSDQGNVLSHIISQLRPGADLSRVTLPTFILEPRSMLERITNFMAHPEMLLPLPEIDDPIQRFVSVVKFYLSGWHIKPPGVKKPLNPILGEIFSGYWEYPDGTRGYYISEQTSHHPPKSSYFFMAPEHHIRIDGTLKPRSKFLGNSAASMMEGVVILRLLNRGERYFITQPNMYARGILFGKMRYELGDHCYIRCPELGLMADIEFKTKGWMSGTYDAIGGYIKDKSDKNLFELSGFWNAEMFIKDLSTGKKEPLFNATHAKHTPPHSRPLEEQEDIESQKLWNKTTAAIKKRDQEVATDEKTKIEDQQRHLAAKRQEEGHEWRPRLFRPAPKGDEESLDWIIDAKIDGKTPEEQVKQIVAIYPILPSQTQQSESATRRQDGIGNELQMQRQEQSRALSKEEDQRYTHDQSQDQRRGQHQIVNQAPGLQTSSASRGAAAPGPDLIEFGPPDDSAATGKLPPNFQQQQQRPPRDGTARGPPGKVKRQDSSTHEVDEFVDAES